MKFKMKWKWLLPLVISSAGISASIGVIIDQAKKKDINYNNNDNNLNNTSSNFQTKASPSTYAQKSTKATTFPATNTSQPSSFEMEQAIKSNLFNAPKYKRLIGQESILKVDLPASTTNGIMKVTKTCFQTTTASTLINTNNGVGFQIDVDLNKLLDKSGIFNDLQPTNWYYSGGCYSKDLNKFFLVISIKFSGGNYYPSLNSGWIPFIVPINDDHTTGVSVESLEPVKAGDLTYSSGSYMWVPENKCTYNSAKAPEFKIIEFQKPSTSQLDPTFLIYLWDNTYTIFDFVNTDPGDYFSDSAYPAPPPSGQAPYFIKNRYQSVFTYNKSSRNSPISWLQNLLLDPQLKYKTSWTNNILAITPLYVSDDRNKPLLLIYENDASAKGQDAVVQYMYGNSDIFDIATDMKWKRTFNDTDDRSKDPSDYDPNNYLNYYNTIDNRAEIVFTEQNNLNGWDAGFIYTFHAQPNCNKDDSVLFNFAEAVKFSSSDYTLCPSNVSDFSFNLGRNSSTGCVVDLYDYYIDKKNKRIYLAIDEYQAANNVPPLNNTYRYNLKLVTLDFKISSINPSNYNYIFDYELPQYSNQTTSSSFLGINNNGTGDFDYVLKKTMADFKISEQTDAWVQYSNYYILPFFMQSANDTVVLINPYDNSRPVNFENFNTYLDIDDSVAATDFDQSWSSKKPSQVTEKEICDIINNKGWLKRLPTMVLQVGASFYTPWDGFIDELTNGIPQENINALNVNQFWIALRLYNDSITVSFIPLPDKGTISNQYFEMNFSQYCCISNKKGTHEITITGFVKECEQLEPKNPNKVEFDVSSDPVLSKLTVAEAINGYQTQITDFVQNHLSDQFNNVLINEPYNDVNYSTEVSLLFNTWNNNNTNEVNGSVCIDAQYRYYFEIKLSKWIKLIKNFKSLTNAEHITIVGFKKWTTVQKKYNTIDLNTDENSPGFKPTPSTCYTTKFNQIFNIDHLKYKDDLLLPSIWAILKNNLSNLSELFDNYPPNTKVNNLSINPIPNSNDLEMTIELNNSYDNGLETNKPKSFTFTIIPHADFNIQDWTDKVQQNYQNTINSSTNHEFNLSDLNKEIDNLFNPNNGGSLADDLPYYYYNEAKNGSLSFVKPSNVPTGNPIIFNSSDFKLNGINEYANINNWQNGFNFNQLSFDCESQFLYNNKPYDLRTNSTPLSQKLQQEYALSFAQTTPTNSPLLYNDLLNLLEGAKNEIFKYLPTGPNPTDVAEIFSIDSWSLENNNHDNLEVTFTIKNYKVYDGTTYNLEKQQKTITITGFQPLTSLNTTQLVTEIDVANNKVLYDKLFYPSSSPSSSSIFLSDLIHDTTSNGNAILSIATNIENNINDLFSNPPSSYNKANNISNVEIIKGSNNTEAILKFICNKFSNGNLETPTTPYEIKIKNLKPDPSINDLITSNDLVNRTTESDIKQAIADKLNNSPSGSMPNCWKPTNGFTPNDISITMNPIQNNSANSRIEITNITVNDSNNSPIIDNESFNPALTINVDTTYIVGPIDISTGPYADSILSNFDNENVQLTDIQNYFDTHSNIIKNPSTNPQTSIKVTTIKPTNTTEVDVTLELSNYKTLGSTGLIINQSSPGLPMTIKLTGFQAPTATSYPSINPSYKTIDISTNINEFNTITNNYSKFMSDWNSNTKPAIETAIKQVIEDPKNTINGTNKFINDWDSLKNPITNLEVTTLPSSGATQNKATVSIKLQNIKSTLSFDIINFTTDDEAKKAIFDGIQKDIQDKVDNGTLIIPISDSDLQTTVANFLNNNKNLYPTSWLPTTNNNQFADTDITIDSTKIDQNVNPVVFNSAAIKININSNNTPLSNDKNFTITYTITNTTELISSTIDLSSLTSVIPPNTTTQDVINAFQSNPKGQLIIDIENELTTNGNKYFKNWPQPPKPTATVEITNIGTASIDNKQLTGIQLQVNNAITSTGTGVYTANSVTLQIQQPTSNTITQKFTSIQYDDDNFIKIFGNNEKGLCFNWIDYTNSTSTTLEIDSKFAQTFKDVIAKDPSILFANVPSSLTAPIIDANTVKISALLPPTANDANSFITSLEPKVVITFDYNDGTNPAAKGKVEIILRSQKQIEQDITNILKPQFIKYINTKNPSNYDQIKPSDIRTIVEQTFQPSSTNAYFIPNIFKDSTGKPIIRIDEKKIHTSLKSINIDKGAIRFDTDPANVNLTNVFGTNLPTISNLPITYSDPSLNNEDNWWIWVVVGVGSFIILLIIILIIAYIVRTRNNTDDFVETVVN